MADDDPHERRAVHKIRQEATGETTAASDGAAEREGREKSNAADRQRRQYNRDHKK